MDDLSLNEKLQLSRDDMRQMGYQVIDTLVDYFDRQSTVRATNLMDVDAVRAIASEALPIEGLPWPEVLEQFDRQVISSLSHVDHPRNFAFIPLASNFVGAMADTLAAGYNIFNAVYKQGESASEIERVTVDWLRQIFGMPKETGGIFVSGGSVANLSALAVARQVQLAGDMRDAVAYCSDQMHFVVSRAMRILGFAPHQLRNIASDSDFRLSLPDLERSIAADRTAGKRPFCVIATAGTTNTGAVDPLAELADLCQQEDLWLHVDGAYGAAASLTERGKKALVGMERAHSLAMDAHKWMFQPIECGCVLVRNRHWLSQTFKDSPELLKDVEQEGEELNYMYMGIQLTRHFRALKLWMSLKVFGFNAMRRAIERGFELAELAESLLRDAGKWEIVTPAQMAIVTFRYIPRNSDWLLANEVTNALVMALARDGFAFASSTKLHGKTVLRMCTNNPRTTPDDLKESINLMGRLATELETQLTDRPAME